MANGAEEFVVLVPGFLGFDSFGSSGGARIEYFDHVEADLVAARPDLAQRIQVHRTSPAGSLEHRVQGLFETVLGVLGAASLEGGARRSVVHLVGHSTGGLDAFLLTHPAYAWAGMTPAQRALRARLLEHVGTVVTLAAPLFGTPIARNLRQAFASSLDLVFVLDVVQRFGRRQGPLLAPALLGTILGRLAPMFGVNAPLLRLAGGFDAETARQLSAYWGAMLADSEILSDLAPERAGPAMTALLAGGPGFPRVRHYVTASPRPALTAHAPLRSAIYDLSYLATADASFTPARLPEGTWVVGDASFPGLEAPPRRNDGVVPSTSQAIPGNPAFLVAADHLDVVGHFEGAENTTLFNSGAHFTAERHARLWSHVARSLRAAEAAEDTPAETGAAPAPLP